jgi:hypothetical protein
MNSPNLTTVLLPPATGEASAGIAPARLSDFAPEDRTPRQNWGKFKAHKWGGFTGHSEAAEHHENAAKSHRAAAEHHGKGDHGKGMEHSTKAQQHSQTARQSSDEAHKKASSKNRLSPLPFAEFREVTERQLPIFLGY